MVAKVAGGIIGIGLIGAGGVAFVKPEWLGINKEVPWTPLSQDTGFSDSEGSPYKDKFGSKHKNYLTGIKGKKEGSNDAWWQKSYEQWTKDNKDTLGNKFKGNISGAIKPASESGDANQYLKDICDAIYKSDHGNITAAPDTSDTTKYKEADVWKYCSPLGQKPTTVKEFDNKEDNTAVYKQESNGTKPIGKEEEDHLISVNDEKNNKFWDIRNREFHGKDPFTTKATFGENTDEFFKQGQTDKKDIKDLCKEAYTKKSADTSSSTAPTKTETKKFCSFDSITTD